MSEKPFNPFEHHHDHHHEDDDTTPLDPARFVFHCFTGGPDEARKVLDFGAMISFTGVVTYKNAPEVREAVKLVPADRIMVETDAPFLSPEPHRGTRLFDLRISEDGTR